MEHPLIKLEKLSKYYTSGQNVVVGLYGLDLQFSRGEFVAITGESGSGKSTLSHVLGGILPYESGEFYLNGQPTSHYDSQNWEQYRRDNISFISQSYGILPGASVLSNVVTALRLTGMDKQEAKAAAEDILRQVDLWQLRRRRAAKLSSGQKQRLSIARALAKPAPILIADEPTGNLDPENSRIVIELLAQAAKTRLVLLVTHEFAEAEDHATRHIKLQDGNVVMDAPLRPANVPEEVPARVKKADKKPMSPYVTALQLRSRPIWSGLMALFFSLTAFAVFAFLGAFIIALDDTDTRIYDRSAFFNGDTNRIVAVTQGNRPMTQMDYEAILKIPYVTELETNGYVTDVQYAYRAGVDYKVTYEEVVNPDPMGGANWTITTYQPYTTAPFIKTVPLLAEGSFTLREGRLPEGFYEVVAHSSDGLAVGQKVMVFLMNDHFWGGYQWEKMEFTVVGITDYGQGLYFDEAVGRFCQQVAQSNNGSGSFRLMVPEDLEATKARLMEKGLTAEQAAQYYLTDDQFRCHPNQYSRFVKNNNKEFITVYFANINLEAGSEVENMRQLQTPQSIRLLTDGMEEPLKIDNNCHFFEQIRIMEVSQNTFDQLTWNQNSEQVSITIEDYAYTQRVIDALQDKGYVAVSPYQLGSTQVDEEKAAQREQTLTVCLAALIAVAALQIVLLRAMFSVQTESYKLLSNIGLVSKTAKRSVLWQILGFTALGQLLGGAAIWLCGRLGIERIRHILRYLPGRYIVLLCGVHLVVSLFAALWVMRALSKQVYPLAGKFGDINLEDEEVAAA